MPDVVIVGAGLAGLTCARRLQAAGADVRVYRVRRALPVRWPLVRTAAGAVRPGVVDSGGDGEWPRRGGDDLGEAIVPRH
jgi:predicted NAD/FAD-dependent oxidoreductase